MSHAHYDAGDFIFRKGEAPTNFYVLEQGEVEVLRSGNGAPPEIVAVLGPGSFFGEYSTARDPRIIQVAVKVYF